jgi:phosphate transport system permease protein
MHSDAPRIQRRLRHRRLVNACMLCGAGACALLTVVPLVSVLYYVWSKGHSGINAAFFTHLPKPVGEPGGGMANAIVGSLLMVGAAALMGLPFGLLGGIYLSEYGHSKLAATVRFAADVLNGVPSIVAGVFVYALVVVPMGGFSGLAGALALSVIIVPLVMRTTEEMLRLVPRSQRDAALAVGATEGRTVLGAVVPAARAGLVTGALLAVARIAGETAPLLFTSLGNRFWNIHPAHPTPALPLQIFAYATSPYDDWHVQAWAGALVLVTITLGFNIAARIATRGRFHLT